MFSGVTAEQLTKKSVNEMKDVMLAMVKAVDAVIIDRS
jgi:hypothetical protein